jgi:acetoin utilization protein AcuB
MLEDLMFVKFLMNPDPVCGTPDMAAIEVQELMEEQAIRHLPIVDAEKNLVGLVTKSSLESALPSDVSQFSRFEISYTLSKVKVQSIMVTDVVTIEEDVPIEHAAWLMADRRIGTLPVLSEGKLIGIISDKNIFIAMTSLLGAYEPGIRVTVLQQDKSGIVAKLTNAIHNEGGYLSSCVGYYPKNLDGKWISVCKIQNLDQQRIEDIINNLEEASILDIRQFQEIE